MGWGCFFAAVSTWGGAVLQHQKWGGAVLQISVETPTILCQAIRRSCQSYTLQIYWRLEERRDGAVSRVVSVFFCAVYIVLHRTIDSRGRGLETQAISTISHGPSSIIAATMDAT